MCPGCPAAGTGNRRRYGCGGTARTSPIWISTASGGPTCAGSTSSTRSASRNRSWAGPLRNCAPPEQADRWTWLILTALTQLRLARDLVADNRLPWQAPQPAGTLPPAGSAEVSVIYCPASALRPAHRNPPPDLGPDGRKAPDPRPQPVIPQPRRPKSRPQNDENDVK